ncbi:MAG: flagellar biosynthetic protein FliO [Phycisphaerales bacterium]|nr:flagellar biosynthetic protein FliO [Phycisphaerales bacterium]
MVEVLARTTISAKLHILILRVGHRLLVVNETPAGMSTLAEIVDPDEIASILSQVSSSKPGSISGQFRQMFDHFNGKYEGRLHPSLPKTLADLDDPGSDDTEIITDRSRDDVAGLLSRLRRMNGEVSRA